MFKKSEVSGFVVPGFKLAQTENCISDFPDLKGDSFMSDVVSKLVFPVAAISSVKKRKIGNDIDNNNLNMLRSLEPSIGFATFANTNGEMTCLRFSKNFSQAICGYRDNQIRVFDLSKRSMQSLHNVNASWTPYILPSSSLCPLVANYKEISTGIIL